MRKVVNAPERSGQMCLDSGGAGLAGGCSGADDEGKGGSANGDGGGIVIEEFEAKSSPVGQVMVRNG